MLNEMQDLISKLRELWEKMSDEYYYGRTHDKVHRYVSDISGLAEHCHEIEVNEWNDYTGSQGLDDIEEAVNNWVNEGFRFNVVGYYEDDGDEGCTVEFYVTIPHAVYWKGPDAWLPFTIGRLWELEGEDIEVQVRHVPCPMEVIHA